MMDFLLAWFNSIWTLDYLWMALIVVIGACLQGAGGIGFGMFVGPLLAITHPELVPGPVLVLAGLLSIMSALREYSAIDFRALVFSLAGRLPASVLAGLLFAVLPMRAMAIVFASMILLAVGMSLRGWRVPPLPRNFVIAGALSGFMGTITSVGAPPMALVYQGFSGPQLRATIGVFFAVGAVISLAALAAFGRFGLIEFNYGFSLAPPMLLGFALSNHIVPHVRKESLRLLILAMSGAAAMVLLILQLR